MSKSLGGSSGSAGLPPGIGWRFSYALNGIRRLNEQCLVHCAELARSELVSHTTPTAISECVDSWWVIGRNPVAMTRAAGIPVALLDLNFSDRDWWQLALGGAELHPDGDPRLSVLGTEKQVRELLTLAWAVSREDHRVAQILFGMVPQVSEAISSMLPQDIEVCATRWHAHIGLRWSNAPGFWRGLLDAATRNDSVGLHQSACYSLQLQAGTAIRADAGVE